MQWTALIADDEPIARQVLSTYARQIPALRVVAQAGTGPETVLQCLEHKPDLLFLDVQMPELSGFEALQAMWPHHQPQVIFTTAYDRYALKAFAVNAVDYLLKPFDEDRFVEATRRAFARCPRPGGPDLKEMIDRLVQERVAGQAYQQRLLVKDGRRMHFVKLMDVLCLRADGNYITLQTLQGKHLVYDNLTSLETRLDPGNFVRINRSCIVNLDYVVSLESHFNGESHVTMRDGQTLKWTRFYRDNLKTFLGRDR
jgi:two-component system LytT family response regulator